jgi:hypothetical protein
MDMIGSRGETWRVRQYRSVEPDARRHCSSDVDASSQPYVIGCRNAATT